MHAQPTAGQEFVSATVHLAGAVGVETGHAAHYSAEHVQARIGPALLYFLDATCVDDFTAAVEAAVAAAPRVFDHPHPATLPGPLQRRDQQTSVVVRLRGPQRATSPHGVAATGSLDRRAFLTCQVGGLRLVCHDAEALHRLAHVARTAQRVAHALWSAQTPTDPARSTRPLPAPAGTP